MTLTLFFAILLLTSIVVTFAGIGSTLIITKSFLFRPLQRLFDPDFHMGVDSHPYLCRLFTCPQCMGTWQGFILQLFAVWVIFNVLPVDVNSATILLAILTIILQGFITSWLSLSAYLILKKLGYKTE